MEFLKGLGFKLPQTSAPRNTNAQGGIPVAPGESQAAPPPWEQFVSSGSSAQPPSWSEVKTHNNVAAQVLRDQGSHVHKALVATLSPGPLLPAAVKIEWNVDPNQPVKATLANRPDVKLNPMVADDGQIYVQLEPAGPNSNPQAPYLVFNPQTLSSGLSEGLRPDGQGGFTRGMQEYHNADGSFTLIANEKRTPTQGGVVTEHTRVDLGTDGKLVGADLQQRPAQGLSGALGGLMGQNASTTSTPAQDVQMTPQGLQFTHGTPNSLDQTLNQVRDKAHQWGEQASDAATAFNHKVSGKLEGRLKEFWDFGMKGGLLGTKGITLGTGMWNKTQPSQPPTPPAPPRVSVLHPFSPVLATTPGALFPGLQALMSDAPKALPPG